MESSVLTSLQLWTTAHWGELGSVPRDTSREKELLHPRGNGALQCKCLKEPCSAEFSSSILSSIWEHGEQLILGSPWRAECAEKSWRVNSIQKGLACKELPVAAFTAAFSQYRMTPSVRGHCQCIPLSIFITQPLQRLELDFPRGNGLEYTSD